MRLFRSEEIARAWCARSGRPLGALLSLGQGWALAQAWFTDPRRPGWRRRPLADLSGLVADLGLSGPFWDTEALRR
ncbi:alkylmercury lyase family protein [Oscillochloris sp. ZM17-4]|nr:alkylmercury lyase family protein [Oscillochloris sp. ZM17-4]